MALDPTHIGSWRRPDLARIKTAHATRPVFIGEAGANGSRFHALTATLLVGTANTVRLWLCRRIATASTPTMGAVALTTATITRTVGSFIDDGWAVDDVVILRGATTLANSRDAVLTGVAAQTLTFAAASFTAEAAPATLEFWRGAQQSLSTIAANAGNAAGTPALDLLTDNKPFIDPSPDRSIIVGPDTALFGAVGTTLAAAAYLDLTLYGGDY